MYSVYNTYEYNVLARILYTWNMRVERVCAFIETRLAGNQGRPCVYMYIYVFVLTAASAFESDGPWNCQGYCTHWRFSARLTEPVAYRLITPTVSPPPVSPHRSLIGNGGRTCSFHVDREQERAGSGRPRIASGRDQVSHERLAPCVGSSATRKSVYTALEAIFSLRRLAFSPQLRSALLNRLIKRDFYSRRVSY